MKNLNKNIFTSLYQTESACVICSLKLTQRKSNTPAVEIDSPFFNVKPSIVRIDTMSTTHSFIIHNVLNGTYVDFINSIALCILKARLPCKLVVASSFKNSFLVYSPVDNYVHSFYSEDLTDNNLLEILKEKCNETYSKLLSNI